MNIKINSWASETPKPNYKEFYKNFGKWQDISYQYKSDKEFLDKVFIARAKKSLGGCKKCNTPYIRFKPIKGTRSYRCKCQKTKVNPLQGTHLENFKKPLALAIKVLYDMMVHKNGVSSLALIREFNMDEKTANLLTRRLSDWMHWYLMNQKFTPKSKIEIDEVYPKFNSELGQYYPWKRGVGSERTHGVLVICERNGLSLAIPYDKRNNGEVLKLIQKLIPIENHHIIFTDESHYYKPLEDLGYRHYPVKHSKYIFADGDSHSNSCEGLNSFIKNNLEYTHKGVYTEYLQLYVSRYAFIHSIHEKTFEDCVSKLIDSLPSLHERVTVNYKFNKPLKSEKYAA